LTTPPRSSLSSVSEPLDNRLRSAPIRVVIGRALSAYSADRSGAADCPLGGVDLVSQGTVPELGSKWPAPVLSRRQVGSGCRLHLGDDEANHHDDGQAKQLVPLSVPGLLTMVLVHAEEARWPLGS
jgi:hypothetical protein